MKVADDCGTDAARATSQKGNLSRAGPSSVCGHVSIATAAVTCKLRPQYPIKLHQRNQDIDDHGIER